MTNAISYGSGNMTITVNWDRMKEIILSKKLQLQYEENTVNYELFAIDDRIIYMCQILKGEVPNISDISQAQNDAWKSDFELYYKNSSNLPSKREDGFAKRVVEVNFRKSNVTGSTYYLAIDLNNESNYYKHTSSSIGIQLVGIHGLLIKNAATDEWSIRLGTVLSTHTTGSTIGWIRFGTMTTRDSLNFHETSGLTAWPLSVDLTVSGSDYVKIASNYKETFSDLTNETLIEDASGGYKTVAPGDVVFKVIKFTGTGQVLFHQHLWYFTD